MAVMNADAGEEIVGGWATPKIPEVGIYKLVAKKRVDGRIEWAHFVQRDNGARERVMRGDAASPEELQFVIDTTNRNLRKFFGVSMQPVDYDRYTVGGKKASRTMHQKSGVL
jgi:hypothetical protein